MAVTITLEDRTASALAARASAAGLSIEEYLRQLAGEIPATIDTPPPGTAEDFDAALNELFNRDARPLPPSNLTYTRDEIYDDHD
jgi:hypothetical protein